MGKGKWMHGWTERQIDGKERQTGIRDGAVSYLLVFNAQPTGTVTSRRYTLQNLLLINNKTWLVKRIWVLIQLK